MDLWVFEDDHKRTRFTNEFSSMVRSGTVRDTGAAKCRNPGSNQGPLDLQSNALPTELFRRLQLAVPHREQEPDHSFNI